MNKIKYVVLNRAEGPKGECGTVVFYEEGKEQPKVTEKFGGDFSLFLIQKCHFLPVKREEWFVEVLRQMRRWGESAPIGLNNGGHGGYDKVDVFVEWENGFTYKDRFDMQLGGRDVGGLTFWDGLKNGIVAQSCRVRPEHFSDARWEWYRNAMGKNGVTENCRKILDECELAPPL